MRSNRRIAEALRDGEQAARERHQAQMEMEQALVDQKQRRRSSRGLPIVEQADGSDATPDGENVVVASHPGGTSGDEMGGTTISDPGAGTDPSESATSSGQVTADTKDHGPDAEDQILYEGDERRFEGEGRHRLDEQ